MHPLHHAIIHSRGITMNALLMTIDIMLSSAAIYYSVQLRNVLFPKSGIGMSRHARQWLTLHVAKYDHILMGALVTGLHGLLALALAIFYMPYAALVVCICAGWNSAAVMQALASIKFDKFFAH
jgi:hypothetical protein